MAHAQVKCFLLQKRQHSFSVPHLVIKWMVIRFKHQFIKPAYPKGTAGSMVQLFTLWSVSTGPLSPGHFHHFYTWGTEIPFVTRSIWDFTVVGLGRRLEKIKFDLTSSGWDLDWKVHPCTEKWLPMGYSEGSFCLFCLKYIILNLKWS